jgi:hypothetical protein
MRTPWVGGFCVTEPWEVPVFIDGDWQSGTIRWEDAGPTVAIGDRVVADTKVKLHFEVLVDEDGETHKVSTKGRVIPLEPEIVCRGRFTRVIPPAAESMIYPHSTNLWYTRWQYGKEPARFFVYPILDADEYFLVVMQDNHVVQAHPIKPYEACPLRYRPRSMLWTAPVEVDSFDVAQMLDEPLPDWSCLAKITKGVDFPIEGDTTGQCLDKLIPPWSTEMRNQLKAFLLFLCKPQPQEDPLDFFPRFQHQRLLYSLLLNRYVRRESDDISYIREFWLAHADVNARLPTMAEGTDLLPWMRLMYRTAIPLTYYPELIRMFQQLNRSQQVITNLPIDRKEAQQSQDAWKKRAFLMAKGVTMKLSVRPKGIGLREAVYIGRAYRWPHRHLRFIVRMDDPGGHARYLHHMMLPPKAAQKASRCIHGISEIDYSTYAVNLNPRPVLKDIKNSLNQHVTSLPQLKQKYGCHNPDFVTPLNRKQAMILDYVITYPWLAKMEMTDGIPNTDMNARRIQREIKVLQDRDVVDVQYISANYGLRSIFLEIQGEKKTVLSLVSGLLETLPSCQAMITKDDHAYVLGRTTGIHTTSLAEYLSKKDVNVRITPVTSWRTHTPNFFQRILKEDGEWNDDISELFSQQRYLNHDDTEDVSLPTEQVDWVL